MKHSSWHPRLLGKELDHCCRRAVSYTQDLSFVTGHYKAGGLVPAVTDAPGSGRSLCQARSLSPPEQRPRAAAPCPVTECPARVALRPGRRSQLRTDPGYWCQGLRPRSERGPLGESLRQFNLLKGSDQRTTAATCEITYKGRRSQGRIRYINQPKGAREEYRAGVHNLTAREGYEARKALSHNQWELRDINDTEGSGRRDRVYIN